MSKILFRAGQNNDAAFSQLEKKLEAKAQIYARRAFDHYSIGITQIDFVFRRLLSRKNLEAALFPKIPLTQNDTPKLGERTKDVAFSLQEVMDAGVVTTLQDIEAVDVKMFAGIFVLSATPQEARGIVNHQEEYKYFRPHVDDSKLCTLPNGNKAYYTELSALGYSLGSVLYSTELSDGSHFHLQPFCKARDGVLLETDGIVENVDGLKIYLPIFIEEKGVKTEKTVTVSANITAWGGLPGALMEALPSTQKVRTYSMAGFSEILLVLREGVNQSEEPIGLITDKSQTHHPKSE